MAPNSFTGPTGIPTGFSRSVKPSSLLHPFSSERLCFVVLLPLLPSAASARFDTGRRKQPARMLRQFGFGQQGVARHLEEIVG